MIEHALAAVVGATELPLVKNVFEDVLSVSGVIGVGRLVLEGVFNATEEEWLQKGAKIVWIEHFGVVDLLRVGDFSELFESEAGAETDVGEVAPSGGLSTLPVSVQYVSTVLGQEEVVWFSHVYDRVDVATKQLRCY